MKSWLPAQRTLQPYNLHNLTTFEPPPKTPILRINSKFKSPMKYLLFAALLLCAGASVAQEDSTAQQPPKTDIYKTNGGELIFSFVDMENDGADISNILRFSAFFHIAQKWHFDFGNNFGAFTGYGIRNVGFITENDGILEDEFQDFWESDEDLRVKRRSYSLGVPLAFKLGNFRRGAYVYGGGELELMFNYKAKLFEDGDKEEKFNEWFSDRTNLLNPSVFGGVQFPGGINLQFRYYLLNFLDQDFTQRVDGVDMQPFQNVDSRMFYISIFFNMREAVKREPKKPEERT